ncbi:cytochrome d ubiquinol oxidase subunit II [Alphaproteobacteria bacterium]|nr:cytochrome d ubiquinol oxidase subunit II [Alphaproteobacteria bacterium]
MIDLAFIWAGLIAIAILAYVILDGFDLGIGILFPFLKGVRHRDQAMNTVAPVWDGNETWLVLGGGGLFAVFPMAYAIILPALYAPIIAMLIGLIFRGVAFEFRWRTSRWKTAWDMSFFLGSLTAALSQGIILGALIQGIEVSGRAYGDGWWDWLTPFSLMCGIALVTGYALLGATWLIMKTNHALNSRAYHLAWYLVVAMAFVMGIVSIWTPFLDPKFMIRWFSTPSIYYVSIVPTLTFALFVGLVLSLNAKKDNRPFILTLGLFLTSYIGLGISIYPFMIPPSITIWQAAAPDESLRFLLVGAVILLPIIIGYTAYSYWVFRGKTQLGEGYH